MRLSVIIPVYNVEQYLERCVSSVVSQDIEWDDYEIILVNDGSTDSSRDVANDLRLHYPNIRLFSQENKGQGAARNLGLSVAKGKYVFFVDSDDYLLPNAFKRMLEVAESHNLDILVMQSKSMKQDGSFRPLYTQPFPNECVLGGQQVLLKGYRPAAVWAKMYRRDLIANIVGGFKESIIHEDVDLNMKLFTYAKRVEFIDLYCYVYFWNNMSTDRLMNYNKIMKSIHSEVVIADDFKHFSSEGHLEKKVSEIFNKQAHSMVVSLCYSLFTRYKRLPFSDKRSVVNMMRAYKLLPIKGRTNSKKSDRLKIIVNRPVLMLGLLRIHSCFCSSIVN